MEKEIAGNNKIAFAALKIVKDNIINGKVSINNPIYLTGSSFKVRYRIFWSIFNKEFNRLYKDRYRFITCKRMDIEEELDLNKSLIIIEDIDFAVNDIKIQEKLCDIINKCLANNIQVILCSDKYVDKLELNEKLSSRMKWGLIVYLN